jgi:hypothetical protein
MVFRLAAATLYVAAMVALLVVAASEWDLRQLAVVLFLLSVVGGLVVNRPWALLLPTATIIVLVVARLAHEALTGGSVLNLVGEGVVYASVVGLMAPAALGALIGLVVRMLAPALRRRL